MADGAQIVHIKMAMTSPRTVRFAQSFGIEFYHVTPDVLQTLRSRGQRSRSERDVRY